MRKSRELLENEVTDNLIFFNDEKKALKKWISDAKEKYAIPEKASSDFITLRKNLIEADLSTLFIITDVVLGMDKVREYFDPSEIEAFSSLKWAPGKAEFPLRFKMTKINDEQYIGRISVKELMHLKDAQLINYNENAQRTMKHIVKGGMEYYQISLNKEAVRAIMDSYYSDLYIPNTITLNLPQDADFSYNDLTNEIIIRNAKYLDILDGYHRYIAMSKIYTQNQSFDYDMELRIVQFEEDKAKRFIWQEDQKTKMRKIDSDAMNTAKISNKVVERLNNNVDFVLSGQISRNKGVINSAYLSDAIDIVIFNDVRKADQRALMMEYTKRLSKCIEKWCDDNPDYLNKPWPKKFIYTFIYDTKYGTDNEVNEDILADYEKISADDSIYAGPSLSKADITRTHKLLGREGY